MKTVDFGTVYTYHIV